MLLINSFLVQFYLDKCGSSLINTVPRCEVLGSIKGWDLIYINKTCGTIRSCCAPNHTGFAELLCCWVVISLCLLIQISRSMTTEGKTRNFLKLRRENLQAKHECWISSVGPTKGVGFGPSEPPSCMSGTVDRKRLTHSAKAAKGRSEVMGHWSWQARLDEQGRHVTCQTRSS